MKKITLIFLIACNHQAPEVLEKPVQVSVQQERTADPPVRPSPQPTAPSTPVVSTPENPKKPDCNGVLSSEFGGKRRPRKGSAAVGYEVDENFVPVLQFNNERDARKCLQDQMVVGVWGPEGWTVKH